MKIQLLQIGERHYMVGVAPASGKWLFVVIGQSRLIAGPTACDSESVAKFLGHVVAVHDAGCDHHYCDGECLPWVLSDR